MPIIVENKQRILSALESCKNELSSTPDVFLKDSFIPKKTRDNFLLLDTNTQKEILSAHAIGVINHYCGVDADKNDKESKPNKIANDICNKHLLPLKRVNGFKKAVREFLNPGITKDIHLKTL